MKKNQVMARRLVHIDYLECIAIFFVVIYHATLYPYNFLEMNKARYYILYFFRTILSTCVPLFFFVNGYLLLNRKFDLMKHIKKIIRLTMLTCIWGIIDLILLMFIKNEFLSINELIAGVWTWKKGWIDHLWFMGALICIYVFFPLLKVAFDNSKSIFIYFILICAIFTFGNTFLNNAGSIILNVITNRREVLEYNFFNIFNPFQGIYGYAIGYFCVGGVIGSIEPQIKQLNVVKRNVIASMGIIVCMLGLWGMGVYFSNLTDSIWDVVWDGYDTLFTFFNVIFIYILSLNFEHNNTLISLISRNTLGIYFMHVLLINATIESIRKYPFLCNIFVNILYAILIVIGSLVITFILKKIPFVKNLVT